MSTRNISGKLSILAILLLLFITACNKDNDIVVKPTIDGLEVGYENSKTVSRGADLHLEAQIAAAGTIETVVIEIKPVSGTGWTFSQAYTDGYTGAKNAELHEHIDIPADAALGDYRLSVKVADRNGAATTVESSLKIEEPKVSAALVFTKVSGTGVEGHGDHFHGLGNAVEGAQVTVTFDNKGNAISSGHLHLEPENIYKIALKTYNASGVETQNQYIADATTAANYKAFLIGGSFTLNPNSPAGEGAIFQTRETQYADGATVSGATSTTGVISYFLAGRANEGEKDVTFIMRKLNAGVKANITRVDWNRADYATAFAGTDELKLSFEIHAGAGHSH